jgi:hypothetical protein
MKHHSIVASALAITLAVATGCRVQVDKSKDGNDNNVKVDTPIGGLHVRTDQLSAADLGLPPYPGAQLVSNHDGSDHDKQSADIHIGFGKWQLRVKAVSYQTSDSQDKVLAFYKKALGRYGDVLECNNGQAIGSPAMTREGLTCSDSNKKSIQLHSNDVQISDDADGHNVRAGSKHHQHVVEIKSSNNGTHFALVELELPQDSDDSSSDSQ